jgi:hypothetical protein
VHLYVTRSEDGTQARFRVRCGDANIALHEATDDTDAAAVTCASEAVAEVFFTLGILALHVADVRPDRDSYLNLLEEARLRCVELLLWNTPDVAGVKDIPTSD